MGEISVRFYMSVPTEITDKIDKIVEQLNSEKRGYQSRTKRQDVIRTFIEYCLSEGLVLRSHYGKGCSVVIKNKKGD